MASARTWFKMAVGGIAICVGGPALVQYLRPTDEELFKRFNPEIQKRALAEGSRREQEFDDYVNRLKEWSKSDKSIWVAAQEEEQKRQEAARAQREHRIQSDAINAAQREEMRKELLGGK